MIIDESGNILGESPLAALIIGGVASCAVLLATTMAVLCCLGRSRNAHKSHAAVMTKFRKCTKCHQVECKCNSSSAVAESGRTSDTIKSVQVSSNPAYTTSHRDLPQGYYTDLVEDTKDESGNLYTSVQGLDDNNDNFEYMVLDDIEQEISVVTSPKRVSSSAVPPTLAVPAPALLKRVGLEDNDQVSDEDEDGYVTYNPEKPPFGTPGPQASDRDQVYENIVSENIPTPNRRHRHSYVNDVQKLVQEVEVQQQEEDKLEKCDSYCNMENLQAQIDKQELQELDNSFYVNNLDALVQAAKQLEASQATQGCEASSKANQPVDHRLYANDLFLSLDQKLKEEGTFKRQKEEQEDMYVNSIAYSLPSRQH